MNILLLEPRVKAIAPNIALMKWARWCQQNGHKYRYVRGIIKEEWFKKEKFIPDKIYMSCIFSYYSERYEKTIEYYFGVFPEAEIIVGGVFPTLYESWFYDKKRSWVKRNKQDKRIDSGFGFEIFDTYKLTTKPGLAEEIENITPLYNVEIESEDKLYPRNKIVLYASRGCTNKCGYCAVPRLEGDMKSFKTIREMVETGKKELSGANSVVLYDNNFTEHEYLDDIVSELVEIDLPVDIHGLHVEAFTEKQAKQFERLKWGAQGEHGTAYLRFSFDWVKYRPAVEKAYDIYMNHDIKAGFFCYMLFNWIDDPIDFWNRIVACQEIVNKYEKGKPIFLFPQRYEPFKPKSKDKTQQGLKRNQYVSPKWETFAGKKWGNDCSGADLVRGITRMYTWVHGFLSVTKSKNLFNWIGADCNLFLENAKRMGTEKDFRLDKKLGKYNPTIECEI